MRLFHDGQDYRFYRKLWREAKLIHELGVHRWTLMPNHVHFLIRQRRETGLAPAMHYIQQRYAKYYGRRNKWVGHVWQGRYKSPLIADDSYLYQCGQYIEMNPVRAGLVTLPEEWPWSSARAYARGYDDGITDRLCSITGAINESLPSLRMEGLRAIGSSEALKRLAITLGDEVLQRPGRPRRKRK